MSDLERGEHLLGLRRVAIDELFREALAHLQRDELLLGAVVDVALELAALLVLGRDQALLRRLQVGQPGAELRVSRSFRSTSPAWAARSCTSCSRVGSIGSFAGIDDRERAQQLTLVADLG